MIFLQKKLGGGHSYMRGDRGVVSEGVHNNQPLREGQHTTDSV